MDKYKFEKTNDGKWAVKTKDYFWQRWRPYRTHGGDPIVRDTLEEAMRTVGSAWWKAFKVRVNSIAVF